MKQRDEFNWKTNTFKQIPIKISTLDLQIPNFETQLHSKIENPEKIDDPDLNMNCSTEKEGEEEKKKRKNLLKRTKRRAYVINNNNEGTYGLG